MLSDITASPMCRSPQANDWDMLLPMSTHSVSATILYTGDLRCEAVHGPSGTQIATDAPIDNQGRGEAFSPTDLVATAWATCVLTTMAIVATRHKVELKGATATVDKEMTTSAPRRIAKLTLHVTLPVPASSDVGGVIERVMSHCPVAHSLHPDVNKSYTLSWKV